MSPEQAERLLREIETWAERLEAEMHALVVLIRQALPKPPEDGPDA